MNNRLFSNLIAAVTMLLSSVTFAQNAHYWNVTFGTRSTLLDGAVIGSVADLSAAGDEAYLPSSAWNINHSSAEASFTVGKTLVTFGHSYSSASDQITQLVNLGDEGSSPIEVENTSNNYLTENKSPVRI